MNIPRAAIAVAGVILLGTAVCVWWVFRDTSVVLFDALDPAQLNAVSTDLDRAQIPYRLDRKTGSVSVQPADSQRARMSIMSSGNAFHEAAGFELFNNSDFGMTEFAQKINYQRAMEGELARTISALGEIRYARVHLVLPDRGLFRAQKQQARAAVTVFPERGVMLDAARVRGIQRLVASAVPDLQESDVSVMDETGVVLSGAGNEDATQATGRLAQKQAVERYLSDKVRAVLSKALGEERFAVSVDAAVDLSERTVTTERVLDAPANAGVKRLKETSHTNKGDGGEERLKEVEYNTGREVEQVAYRPGAIRGIQVGVIIDRDVSAVDVAELRELVAAAVGADSARGDKVTVVQHSIAVQRVIERLDGPSAPPQKATTAPAAFGGPVAQWLWPLAAVLALAAAVFAGAQRAVMRHKQLRREQLRRQLAIWSERDHRPTTVTMSSPQVQP